MILIAAALLAGLATIGLAVSVAPLGFGGYVSEAGVPGTPLAWLYQLSVLGVAGSATLLASVLRRPLALGALALAVAGPAIALSAVVPCTSGCPLPPYEESTARDLVHAAGSLTGVGACALAMLVVAWRSSGPLQRVSRVAVAVSWPVLFATAVSIVAAGRGPVSGTLERVGLASCLLWMVAVAVCLYRLPGSTPRSHQP